NCHGLPGAAEHIEANPGHAYCSIELLRGEKIADGLERILDRMAFVLDPPPAVAAGPRQARAMFLRVSKTGETFGGPAMNPDRAVGKAVNQRQGLQPRQGDSDGSDITRTVTCQNAGKALRRHRQVRYRGLQKDLLDMFAARDAEELFEENIARADQ